MEFSKKQIEEAMDQYLQDNEDFGDGDESHLISEIFNGFKSLILENTSSRIPSTLLQEHANGLQGIPRDIFEDFVLYLNLTEIESRLL
jgi:hypothetical protein